MSRFSKLEIGQTGHAPESAKPMDQQATLTDEATASFHGGDFARALQLFGRILDFSPREIRAWAGQVRMLIEMNRLAEADAWANKGLAVLPDEPALLSLKAVIVARNNDPATALTLSDAAVSSGQKTPEIWLARADVLAAAKSPQASYCFDKAVELAPGDWSVKWLAARVCRFHELFAQALKYAQQAIALDASQAVVWYEVGQAQLALGMNEQARTSFLQGQALNPGLPMLSEALQKTSGGWLADTGRRMKSFFSR